jgi:hypothetical protein
MPAHRKDEKAAGMLALYAEGFSLAQVAKAFGVTRQSVYKMLRKRGYAARATAPLPFISWGNAKYTIDGFGYYRRTDDDRRRLHVDIWESENGPLPEGFDVHHADGDKTNNTPGNLELLSCSEHGRRHGFGGNQYTGSLGTRPIR